MLTPLMERGAYIRTSMTAAYRTASARKSEKRATHGDHATRM